MERITVQELPQGMMGTLLKVEHYINRSGLDIQLLEMIRLRVSQINGCAYCIDHHYKELQHTGETALRMYSLSAWRETPYYTEKERLVLEFTEQLTRLDQKDGIGDELFERLIQHFSKEEISFLALAISQINTWTRLMRTFQFSPGNYQVQQAA